MTGRTRTYMRRVDGSNQFLRGRLGEPCACGWVCETLCDYPVGDDKTCDRRMCVTCSHEIAPNTHYCSGHKKLWDEFVARGGIEERLKNVIPYPTEK